MMPTLLPPQPPQCADEPIRTPGAIQPHGWMAVMDWKTQRLVAASANWDALLGTDTRAKRAVRIESMLCPLSGMWQAPVAGDAPMVVGRLDVEGRSLDVSVHRVGSLDLFEFEAAFATSGMNAPIYQLTQRLLPHLQRASTIDKLVALAVMEMKRLTGFGRVLGYRFDTDGHGEVLAESRDAGYDSYAGHRFPAMDIPSQARELYRLNHIRLIADAHYVPVPLEYEDAHAASSPIDLSSAALRSVSPVHLEYMRNMGTLASMSVSLVVRDQLWGLISCHDHQPRHLDHQIRAACEHLGRLLSLQIAAKEENIRIAEAFDLRQLTIEVMSNLSESDGSLEQLLLSPSPLLKMAGAGGAALVLDGRCWTAGITPSTQEVQALAAWVFERGQDTFCTDTLAAEFAAAAPYVASAAGVLAISLSQVHRHIILWFRPELLRAIRWAGEPVKPTTAPGGTHHPRSSFDTWVQLVGGRSAAWEPTQVAGASELRNALVRIVLRNSQERDKAANEILRLNRELAVVANFSREIADTVPGQVAYVDDEACIRFANPAYARWLEASAEHIVGLPLEQLCAPNDWKVIRPRLEAALEGIAQHFEMASTDASGARTFWQSHFMPQRTASGSVQGVYVMSFDITRLKATESSLNVLNAELSEARDAAQSATRAKSAFLANISHEIRTPMNAIVGLTHLLMRDSRSAQQRDRLQKIGEAARHLLMVINDVLELSKIEAGKLTLLPEDFELDSLMSRCFEMVRERAKDKGLELVLDTDHLPPLMRGDSTRVSQMLINLLSNAVKFTDRGWVWLRGRLVEATGDQLMIRFEVQDTGPGISAERQAALFSAFDQADNSLTRRHAGTGLGLALTRQLAQAMQGNAGVASTPGVGSTFWFTIRLERASRRAPRTIAKSMAGLNALVIDDLQESLDVVTQRLKMMGLLVHAHLSGASALRSVAAQLPAGRVYDVVMIDSDMDGMDGNDTLRRLRESLGDATPPSILMAATNDPVVRALASVARFDAVLTKPITASELHDALASALKLERRPMATKRLDFTEVEALVRKQHFGQTVLLVEDNAVNLEVGQELLHSVGLNVQTAEDGQRALEMSLANAYDLILMDMQMPVLDGLEVTRRLRAAGTIVPVIAMTANAFSEDRAMCLEAGMNDHVAKPVDPTVLYEALMRWLPARGPESQRAQGSAATPEAIRSAQDALIDKLSAIGGFDVQTCLRQVGGHPAAAFRILDGFSLAYAAGEPSLLGSPSGDSRSQWLKSCHSIRGASGAIGAFAVSARVGELELAIGVGAAPPTLTALGSRVHVELLSLATALARVLETPNISTYLDPVSQHLSAMNPGERSRS